MTVLMKRSWRDVYGCFKFKPADGRGIGRGPEFLRQTECQWHERALQAFMVIVLGHWAEHLVQAHQIYVMGWPRPQANGVLGLWYPWLIKSKHSTMAMPW